MPKIFISYRRVDSEDVAGRIYDRLVQHFGHDAIFKDVDDIPCGVDFRDYLNDSLNQCQVVLAVIGQTWLSAADGSGRRRIDNPVDWVRMELEESLRREDVLVVPLLVRRAELPRADELPESIVDLAYRNYAQARPDPDFNKDMSRLITQLEAYFNSPDSVSTQRPNSSRKPNTSFLPKRQINRRKILTWAVWGSGGLAVFPSVRLLLRALEPNPQPTTIPSDEVSASPNQVEPPPQATTSPEPAVNESDNLRTKEFEVVKVNDVGEIVDRQTASAEYFSEDLSNGIGLVMVKIPGGKFLMGQSEAEKQTLIQQVREDDYQRWYARELPRHEVNISEFWMGQFQVTQAQYQLLMGENPSHFSENGASRPVEQVSWHDAVAFCEKLTQQTGSTYRLPSEAEWEYACRAGTITPFHFGETITTDLVNYDGNYTYGSGPKGTHRERTTEVGSFPPNAFGLYDMHGNVWEWCQDNWHENYQNAPTDESAWIANGDSDRKIVRGGSWGYNPRDCRSAYRNYFNPRGSDLNFGFRVVCRLPRILP